MMRAPIVHACVVAALAGSVYAQSARTTRVVTDRSGTYLVRESAPLQAPWLGTGLDTILWTFSDPISIPETCALAPLNNSAWVGEQTNTERLQRFDITGNGTPTFEVLGIHATGNPAAVAAAKGGDLAVFLDQISQGGPLFLTAYHSNSATAIWTVSVPETYNYADIHAVKVSRDGSTVALVVSNTPTGNPPPPPTTAAFFINGNDGSARGTWIDPRGSCSGVDLTDDGSLAIVCQGAPPAGFGRLINTTTGTVVQDFNGDGAGGTYNLSGDGSVIVIGGFDFRVFVKVAGVYTQRITFNAPTSWFSFASAVSRDGSTVGALAHNYNGYLTTTTRIWDVASGQLLGTYNTSGSGTEQDSAAGASMADDGSRFVAASWGDQGNSHPQVMVFDRTVNLIGSLSTPGSPFSLDMSGDGQYILSGSKSVHANVFGAGGEVNLLQMSVTTTCYANCDGSTSAPVLNVLDFTCFLQKFAAADAYANCDGSTTAPTLNVLDFTCFLQKFASGCH